MTFIEKYKGFEISFDKDECLFKTNNKINQIGNDEVMVDKDFKNLKKQIDQTISNIIKNVEPFYIENTLRDPMFNDGVYKKLKVLGLGKNKKFVCEDDEGNIFELSQINEKDYIVFNEKISDYKEKVREISEKMFVLATQRGLIFGKIRNESVTLTEYKKTLII